MLKKYGQRTKLVKLLTLIPLLLFMIFTMSFSIEEVLDQPINASFTPASSLGNKSEKSIPNSIEKPEYTIKEQICSTDLSNTNIPHKVSPKEIELLGKATQLIIQETRIEDKVFLIVDESASPKSEDLAKFYRYVAKNMKYPKQAHKLGIEGRVFVEFVVDKSGNLSEVKL